MLAVQTNNTRAHRATLVNRAMRAAIRSQPLATRLLLTTTALASTGFAHAQTVGDVVAQPTAPTQISTVSNMPTPILNVGLSHGGFSAMPGAPVAFTTYWNYDGSIKQAVVRVFKASDKWLDNPIATVDVSRTGSTSWTPDAKLTGEYQYVLRVFDTAGNYDETRARPLRLTLTPEKEAETHISGDGVYRQDNTAVRNIRVLGYTAPPQIVVRQTARPMLTPVPTPLPTPAPAPLTERAAEIAPPTTVAPPAAATGRVDVYVEGSRPALSGDADTMRRLADAALDAADIRMSYDALAATPMLNAGLAGGASSATLGETVTFETYWNYNHWISRGEIRVFDRSDKLISAPIAILPLDENGAVNWTVPDKRESSEYSFVLRVFDKTGAFDETREKSVQIVRAGTERANPVGHSPVYGEDNTGRRNIQVNGGTVTVSGRGLSDAQAGEVRVLGRAVVADPQGNFAVSQIVPAGKHVIDVAYVGADGTEIDITRDVTIPQSDWFLVALGDLTIGTRSEEGRALVEAAGEEFDETYVTGRAAFYLKGKVQGKYLVTAALDTQEDDIDNLLSGLDEKSPEALLRRVDPDRYYAVYGDDSTTFADAPTQGRFYVRIERGDDQVVWGNFLTDITNTEFAQIDRGLYGGKFSFNSDATTSFGERRSRITAFAADPGTLPSREEFRGTGGSVYFLENQDLTIGSERLRIEVRDEESGLVLETHDLNPFIDYEVDYIQGRVLLARPLTSTRLAQEIVRDGSLSGNAAYLVARYEYQPTFADLDGMSTGGRAEGWLGERVRFGVTALDDESGDVDQTLLAIDAILRASDDTYLKAEVAQTDGAGFSERTSADGGFTYDALQSGAGDDAQAMRIEGAAAIGGLAGAPGRIAGYIEQLDQGFSAPGRQTPADTERVGASLSLGMGDDARNKVAVKIDQVDIDRGVNELTASADVRRALNDAVSVGVGVRHSDVEGSLVGREGTRTDLGVEAEYAFNETTAIYAFGQGTVDRDGSREASDRGGLGVRGNLTDKITLKGEVSGGDGGTGALGELGWLRNEGETYYLNYALDAERREPGVDGASLFRNSQNTLTVGGQRRFSDWVSVYGEQRTSFGDSAGLTNAFGLDFTPVEALSFGVSFEIGDLEERQRLIEREAYTASAGYVGEGVTVGGAFEWRDDSETIGGIVQTRDTWLVRTNASVQASPDWRAIAKFNKAESNASGGRFFDGEFTEAQIGGAFRPVDNDRLNALVRLTYFEDLPGAEQVSSSGTAALPAQKSKVLSLDGNYRLTDWLTLGGKVGYRDGEVSLTRTDDTFVESDATLLVARADFNIVRSWDGLVEARRLSVDAAGDENTGVLAAIYRHIGDHAKVGVGYNFTDFSDDLTDLTFDDDGVFLNLVAKF
jgi:Bacterial Ig-like domain